MVLGEDEQGSERHQSQCHRGKIKLTDKPAAKGKNATAMIDPKET